MFNAVTTGGGDDAYRKEGYNRFTMRELLAPFDQTAYLCGMTYLAPFVVHGALRLAGEATAPAVGAYRRLLEAVRDDKLDLQKAAAAAHIGEVQV
jgi:glutathione-regulated potassium-efflux system ancillary protein KefG